MDRERARLDREIRVIEEREREIQEELVSSARFSAAVDDLSRCE